MRHVIAAACIVFVLGASAWSVDGIGDVKTLEDLRAVKPIRLASDWEVRLGVSDGGEAAESWRLLYCLAKYVGEKEGESVAMEVPPGFSGRHGRLAPLGPVHFAVAWGREREIEGHFGGATQVYDMPREVLFCALAPVMWHGGCSLLVFEQREEPEARVIAERRFSNLGHPAHSWSLFAKPEQRNRDKAPLFRVHPHYFAAWPKYDRCKPILDLTTWKTAPPEGGTPLPGKLPMGTFWLGHYVPKRADTKEEKTPRALKLSLEGNRLAVRSEAKMVPDPTHRLLVRWWVNGKTPKVFPTADRKAERLESGASPHEMHVTLDLPGYLGDLKPGDKIALEVLYTPRRFQIVRRPGHDVKQLLDRLERLPDRDVARVPMLSNRIEFVVTQAMLDARGKPEKP